MASTLTAPEQNTDLDSYIQNLELKIIELCKNNRKKRCKAKNKSHAVWWTTELGVLRNRVRAS